MSPDFSIKYISILVFTKFSFLSCPISIRNPRIVLEDSKIRIWLWKFYQVYFVVLGAPNQICRQNYCFKHLQLGCSKLQKPISGFKESYGLRSCSGKWHWFAEVFKQLLMIIKVACSKVKEYQKWPTLKEVHNSSKGWILMFLLWRFLTEPILGTPTCPIAKFHIKFNESPNMTDTMDPISFICLNSKIACIVNFTTIFILSHY